MYYAKPKMSNNHDAETFTTVMEAVNYLNTYNEMGPEYEGNGSVSKLQAEDWWLLGKLTAPKGLEFRNNKVVVAK